MELIYIGKDAQLRYLPPMRSCTGEALPDGLPDELDKKHMSLFFNAYICSKLWNDFSRV